MWQDKDHTEHNGKHACPDDRTHFQKSSPDRFLYHFYKTLFLFGFCIIALHKNLFFLLPLKYFESRNLLFFIEVLTDSFLLLNGMFHFICLCLV